MCRALLIVLFLVLSTVKAYCQCTPIIGTNPNPPIVCEDVTIQFSDNTACTSLARRWDFGDGSSTTNVQNPSHTFSAGRQGDTIYTVTLEKQDLSGVWTNTAIAVTVYKKPDASFLVSNTTACIIVDTLQFTNTSSMPPGNQLSWNFGDGSPQQNIANPKHTYTSTASSSYTVELTVTNQKGCSRSATKVITVNEIPNPNFTMDANIGCDPLEVTFTNTTAEGAFPVTGWQWDFGSFGSSTNKNPNKVTFTGANVYSVSLSATNTAGCTNTTSNAIVVKKTPIISFSNPSEICAFDTATISYSGDADGNASYNWDFGSGQVVSGNGKGPWQVVYATSGNHDFSVEISQNGCVSEGSGSIKVYALPQVNLVSSDPDNGICVGESITFSATPAIFEIYSFYNDGVEIQRGNSPQLLVPNLSMPNRIWVEVVDKNGCGSNASNNIVTVVNQKPSVSISSLTTVLCQGDTFTIEASGNFPQYTFESNFEELQSGPSKVFKSASLKDGDVVIAYATDFGCKGIPSNGIQVTVDEPLNPPVLNCGSSTNNSVTVLWNDDPLVLKYKLSVNQSNFYSPLTRASEIITGLNANDTVWFALFGESNLTCGNTPVTDSVYCLAKPCLPTSLSAPENISLCAGDTAFISINNLVTPSSGYGISWGGGDFNRSQSESFVAEQDTTVVISIIDSLQIGCPLYEHRVFVKVNESPVTEIEIESLNLCEGLPYSFEASQPGYDRYQFLLNDVLVQDSSYYIYTNSSLNRGSNKLSLHIDEKGCSSSDSIFFEVRQKQTANISSSAAAICSGDPVVYFAAATNFDYYTFINTLTGDTLQDSTNTTLTLQDIYAVHMVAIDEYGCLSYPDSVTVIEKTLPTASITSDAGSLEVCENDAITFTFSSPTATQYNFYRDYHLLQNGAMSTYQTNDIQDGKKYFVVPVADGCEGYPSDTLSFSVKDTLTPPQPYCGTTSVGSVEVLWDNVPNALGYRISVDAGSFVIPSSGSNSLSHLVTGLNENDSISARLFALGNDPCGNSVVSAEIKCYITCENPFSFQQNFIEKEICAGENVHLQISNLTGGSGNFTIRWNGLEGMSFLSIQPKRDTVITVSVTDNEQVNCPPVVKNYWIEVNPIPVVNLNGPTLICSDEKVSFTANPSSYGNYSFFDRALSLQNSSAPFISDSLVEDGAEIYVIAEESGCSDTSNILSLEVIPKVLAPELYCGVTTTSSIEFSWHAVPGAVGYEISINGFAYITPSSGATGLSHLISGLGPGESITAKVRALGQAPCGHSVPSELVTCYAIDCSPMTFAITPDTAICTGEELTVSITDVVSPSGNYSFSWDNSGASRITSSSYNLTQDRVIRVSMVDSSQLNCPATIHQTMVEVKPLPTVTLTSSVSGTELCETDTVSFYAQSNNATILQFYQDYFAIPNGYSSTYRTGDIEEGRYYYVVPFARGCAGLASDSFSFTVGDTLIPPQINCGLTGEGTLEFIWDSVPGAIAYQISVDNESFKFPSSGPQGLLHLVDGLNDKDSAVARVIAVGADPCGSSSPSASLKCYLDCEFPFSFSQNFREKTFCEGDEVRMQLIDLEGGTGNFTIWWNEEEGDIKNVFEAKNDTVITVRVKDNLQPSCAAVTKKFWITVNPLPTVNLSVVGDGDYCSDGELELTASPSSYGHYEFFDRVLSLGAGPEPSAHDSAPDPENAYYVVALEKGCYAKSNIVSVDVVEKLRRPQVFCGGSTVSTISFEWHEVPGATGYQISLNGQIYETPSSGATGLRHEITGLSPNTAIAAVVKALGPQPCGASQPSEKVSCFAKDCGKVSFRINGDTSVCEGSELRVKINEITSPSGQISFNWNEEGPSKKLYQDYLLDKDTVVVVTMVDSSQLICPSTKQEVNIEVKALPDVVLTSSVVGTEVCENEEITFTAESSTASSFDFYRGFHVIPVGITNSYTAATPRDGQHYFVIPVARGCRGMASDTFTYNISDTLIQPQLNCGKTGLGTIELVWDEVEGATGYEISVNGEDYGFPSSGIEGLTHVVDGLNENDSIRATLYAVGPDPCGNSRVSDVVTCYISCDKPFNFEQNFNEKDFCAGELVKLEMLDISGGTEGGLISAWNGVEGNSTQEFVATQDTLITATLVDTNQKTCAPVVKKYWVTVNPIPEVELLGASEFCSDDLAVFTASPSPYENYEFFDRVLSIKSSADPTLVDSVVEDGHYYYVVATDLGCVDTSNIIHISVSEALDKPDLFCGNTSTSNINFEWNEEDGAIGYEISINGGPFQTPTSGALGLLHELSGLTAGEEAYALLRAIAPEPCGASIASDTVTCIAQDCGKMAFEISQDTSICEGSNYELVLSNIESPSNRVAFSWNGGDFGDAITRNIVLGSDSLVTVTMHDSTQLNCPAPTLKVQIDMLELPRFELELEADSFCYGQPMLAKSSVEGYDQYRFFLDGNLVQDSILAAYASADLDVGSYTLQASANHKGCSFDTQEISFEILEFPDLALLSSESDNRICEGESVLFTASEGFHHYSFYRSGAIAQDSIIRKYTLDNVQDGEGVFVVASTYNLCFAKSELIRTRVNPIPDFVLSSSDPDGEICDQDSVTFTVSPKPDHYEVFNHGFSLGSNFVQPSFSTDTLESDDLIYILGYLAGCTDYSDSLSINVAYRPTVIIAPERDSVCVGEELSVYATGGDSYSWSNGGTDTSTVITPAHTGYISVTTTVGNCESFPDSALIFVDEFIPVVGVSPNPEICRYETVQIFAEGGDRYFWISGDSISDPTTSAPLVTPLKTDTFIVVVSNLVCSDTAEVIVLVDRCLTELPQEPPQIITPNGDGKNDYLIFEDVDYFQNAKLTIYNRWSNVVFEANNYNNDWSGINQNGADLPAGTYYYVLELGNGREAYTNFLMIQR